jgi:predicted nucleic acid-binding protein
MSVEVFLDTNVFVYTFDARVPEKQRRARELVRSALGTGKGAISWQVTQEFLNIALRKFEEPLTPGEAADYLDQVLTPLWKVSPSPELTHEALSIQRQTQFGFYDSLIVAAAIRSGAAILYSEDLQHGRTIGGTRILNPFA